MRFRSFLVAVVGAPALLTGCFTTVDLKHPEYACASSGQLLEGTTHYDSSAYVGSTSASSSATITRCAKPKTDAEVCRVKAAQESMAAGQEHNNNVSGKNMAMGFGYLMYVVPGLALNYYWSDEAAASLKTFTEKSQAAYGKCSTVAH
jgi:hypothetical protein